MELIYASGNSLNIEGDTDVVDEINEAIKINEVLSDKYTRLKNKRDSKKKNKSKVNSSLEDFYESDDESSQS
jgi:hypothetical protein